MNPAYKEEHEKFVTNYSGSSFFEVISIVTSSVCFTAVTIFLQHWVLVKRKSGLEALTLFKFDIFGIVCPIVLSCTLLSDYSIQLFIASCLVLVGMIVWELSTLDAQGLKKFLRFTAPAQRRPSITIFRSLVNVISVFCILAVDFAVFPRRHAKTENYGYSLMDTGVGFYVVSHGIVTHPRRKDLKLILKSIVSSWPLFALGLVRYLSIETLKYQNNVTEYGAHWNFFFTLGFVKVFGALIMSSWPDRITIISIVIYLGHLLGLSSGFQDWALSDAPRDDLFSANREGLLSLPGYLALFLASVSFGSKLLTEQRSVTNEFKFAVKSMLWSLVLFLVCFLFEANIGITRRLANATYVLWMIALSLFVFSVAIIAELVVLLAKWSNRGAASELRLNLLEAVNYNALFYFLLCNLLTGLVNMSVKTIHKSTLESMAILIGYMLITSTVIQLLYLRRISIKFW